jgi:hypothetical protein
MSFQPILPEDERIAAIIVDAALAVHRALGPGLLESVYEVCLAHELRKRGLNVRRQEPILITYDGLQFEEGFDVICSLRNASFAKSSLSRSCIQSLRPRC